MLRVWKGNVPRNIAIGPTDCPPTPDRGRWLVYGYDGGGIWHANVCGRSRPIANASDDLAQLGAASEPYDEPRDVVPPSPTASGDPMASPPLGGGPPPEPPRPSSCACRAAIAGESHAGIAAALAIVVLACMRRKLRIVFAQRQL